jgi:hypothetical protein
MYYESSVDWQRARTCRNGMGMRMTAKARFFFEQPDFVLMAEQIGCCHP